MKNKKLVPTLLTTVSIILLTSIFSGALATEPPDWQYAPTFLNHTDPANNTVLWVPSADNPNPTIGDTIWAVPAIQDPDQTQPITTIAPTTPPTTAPPEDFAYAFILIVVVVIVLIALVANYQMYLKRNLKKAVPVAVSALLLLSCFAVFPSASADQTATDNYYLSNPTGAWDFQLCNYTDDSIGVTRGSDWANLMTFVGYVGGNPSNGLITPPWAGYTTNYTAAWENVFANITDGLVESKGVAYPVGNALISIPDKVEVNVYYQGDTYKFTSSGNSAGSPYTIAVGAKMLDGYYTASDADDRIIDSFTSTNSSQVFADVPKNNSQLIVANGSYIAPVPWRGDDLDNFEIIFNGATLQADPDFPTADVSLIELWNCDNGKISGFGTLDLNKDNLVNENIGKNILLRTCINIEVSGLNLINAPHGGVAMLNTNNSKIINNVISGSDLIGIAVESKQPYFTGLGSCNNTIAGNTINGIPQQAIVIAGGSYNDVYGNYITDSRYGVGVMSSQQYCHNNDIHDNFVNFNMADGRGGTAGLYLNYSDANILTNNKIEGNYTYGIEFIASSHNILQSSTINGSSGNSLFLTTNSNSNQILGGMITNSSWLTNSQAAIQITTSSNNTIKSTIIDHVGKSTTGNGWRVSGGVGNIFDGVTVQDTLAVPMLRYCAYMDAAAAIGTVIVNCNFANFATAAVLNSGTDTIFGGNNIINGKRCELRTSTVNTTATTFVFNHNMPTTPTGWTVDFDATTKAALTGYMYTVTQSATQTTITVVGTGLPATMTAYVYEWYSPI